MVISASYVTSSTNVYFKIVVTFRFLTWVGLSYLDSYVINNGSYLDLKQRQKGGLQSDQMFVVSVTVMLSLCG